jgi:riboflavin kinase/FMN adenylyltransferase
VITIGTFDGVHRGHQKVIESLKAEAETVHWGETVLITFHPHPRKIVNTATSLQLINTLDEKISLLAQHGIGHLVIVPFTESFAQQDGRSIYRNFPGRKPFIRIPSLLVMITGLAGPVGQLCLVATTGSSFNYHLIEIPKHLLNEIAVSSTKIRNALFGK